MGRRKQTTGPETFLLSRSACITMMISAAEVYPRECMGGVCIDKNNPSHVVSAHPWQKARRKYLEVVSESSFVIDKLLSKSQWHLCADYHSHTYRVNEKLDELVPSNQDLRSLEIGGVEFIIRIHKVKRAEYWMMQNADGGFVEGAIGRFRFQIKAFRRTPALDSKTKLVYKTLRVKLDR